MGRSPCCSKEGLNRGAWTVMEDKILTSYIKVHGEGKWRNLPKRAGLKRCGKSCRLRWLNYLRPDIKRGNISDDEEELIIRLHKLLGNRWSLIAGRLPGRTDNEIKNYWNTTLGKKAKARLERQVCEPKINEPSNSSLSQPTDKIPVIRTKATRYSKALVPLTQSLPSADQIDTLQALQHHRSYRADHPRNSTNPIDRNAEDYYEMHSGNHDSRLFSSGCHDDAKVEAASYTYNSDNMCTSPVTDQSVQLNDPTIKCWNTNILEDNTTMNLESLAFLLNPEDWP